MAKTTITLELEETTIDDAKIIIEKSNKTMDEVIEAYLNAIISAKKIPFEGLSKDVEKVKSELADKLKSTAKTTIKNEASDVVEDAVKGIFKKIF